MSLRVPYLVLPSLFSIRLLTSPVQLYISIKSINTATHSTLANYLKQYCDKSNMIRIPPRSFTKSHTQFLPHHRQLHFLGSNTNSFSSLTKPSIRNHTISPKPSTITLPLTASVLLAPLPSPPSRTKHWTQSEGCCPNQICDCINLAIF